MRRSQLIMTGERQQFLANAILPIVENTYKLYKTIENKFIRFFDRYKKTCHENFSMKFDILYLFMYSFVRWFHSSI